MTNAEPEERFPAIVWDVALFTTECCFCFKPIEAGMIMQGCLEDWFHLDCESPWAVVLQPPSDKQWRMVAEDSTPPHMALVAKGTQHQLTAADEAVLESIGVQVGRAPVRTEEMCRHRMTAVDVLRAAGCSADDLKLAIESKKLVPLWYDNTNFTWVFNVEQVRRWIRGGYSPPVAGGASAFRRSPRKGLAGVGRAAWAFVTFDRAHLRLASRRPAFRLGVIARPLNRKAG